MAKKKKSKLQRLFSPSRKSKVSSRKLHQRRIMLLAVLLVAAIGTYLTFQSRAAISVQPGMAVDFGWGANSKEVQKETELLKNAGVKWIRTHCNWEKVQKSAGSRFSWYCDRNIDTARSAGINVLMNLMNTPSWAQTGYSNVAWPPTTDHYNDWSNYVKAAVTHFKSKGVQHYEIWNEENSGRFWKGRPSATEYTRFLQISYRAVKAADPTAKVVFGGTARNDYSFISSAYSAGAKGYFDIMATHPYTNFGYPPEVGSVTDKYYFPSYKEVYRVMSANGDSHKDIWFTEIGWSTCTTHPACVSEAKQAEYLRRMYNYINPNASYVPVAFWYNFRNNRWANNANNWEDQLGVITSDMRLKPAYNAHKALFNP